MSPNMRRFLERAARCAVGKGIFLLPKDRRTAGQAVSQGYGMTVGIPGFEVFIIEGEGRSALQTTGDKT